MMTTIGKQKPLEVESVEAVLIGLGGVLTEDGIQRWDEDFRLNVRSVKNGSRSAP